MDYTDPSSILPALIGGGLLGLLFFIVLMVVLFAVSAFITSLWIRLIIVFMRRALDREYGRMRMAGLGFAPGRARGTEATDTTGPVPLRNGPGPRDWEPK